MRTMVEEEHLKTKQMTITLSVFSLSFSLAGKGPFLIGKAKNMHQRRTFLPGEGLRIHEASCQPIDRKAF